jgi:Domain of unknown function (DUF4116)
MSSLGGGGGGGADRPASAPAAAAAAAAAAIPHFMMDGIMEEEEQAEMMMMFSYAAGDEDSDDDDDDDDNDDCKPPAVVMPSVRRENISSSGRGRSGDDEKNRRAYLDLFNDPHDCSNNSCASLWKDLPPCYQVDKEFILKALTFDTLPAKSDFERKFPQTLRFDRDVVLAFCARSDFETLYYERHLFVPDCLTNDKDVMMAFCRRIPRSLQECSETLINDKDVVMAAVQKCGLELQYASYDLRADKEVVMAACQNDGRALEFCPPGDVRDELTSDRDFMLAVLQKHGGPMLRIVAEPLKRDRQLLLEALKHGMRLRFCPFEFQTEKEFLLETLARRSELYLEMNRNVLADRDVAFAAMVSESSTQAVFNRALQHVPFLSSNRDVVLAICQRGDAEYVLSFLTDTADLMVKDDKEIMLAAIGRDAKIFRLASGRLQRDVEIILASLAAETASDVLASVGAALQEEHPQITVRAINVASIRCLRLVRPLVPEALWMNRDVAIAWIRRTGGTLDAFDALLQTDEEMCMEVAEHAWRDFGRVGEALRSNVAFMTRAVDVNGRVLRYASREIRQDLDLAVRAIASHPDALGSSAAEGTALFGIDCNAVRDHVQSKLDLHTTFVRDFLRGIAITKPHLPPARRSQLTMLDRGVETSEAFKQLIAEFLGVPVGANLKIMRIAMRNLTSPPSASSAESSNRRSAAAMDDADFRAFDHHAERWARRRLLRRRMREMRDDRVINLLDGAAGAGGAGNNINVFVGGPIAPPGGAERLDAAMMMPPMPDFARLLGPNVPPPAAGAAAAAPIPLAPRPPNPRELLIQRAMDWGRAGAAGNDILRPVPVAARAAANLNIVLRADDEAAQLRGLQEDIARAEAAAAHRRMEAIVLRERNNMRDEVEALRLVAIAGVGVARNDAARDARAAAADARAAAADARAAADAAVRDAVAAARDAAAAAMVPLPAQIRPPPAAAAARRGPRADLRRRLGMGDLFDDDVEEEEEEMFALMMEAGMDDWDEPLI